MPFDSKPFRAAFRTGLLLIVLFELVSFWAFIVPEFSSIAFLVIVAATVVLAVVRPDLALLALLAELFIGSQGGYMVAFGLESGLALSMRIGLFLAVFGVWAAKLIAATFAGGERRKSAWAWLRSMARARLLKPYILLLAVIAFGVVRGIVLGNDLGDVFFDANAYAYFALFPAFVTAYADHPALKSSSAGLLAAAIVTSVAKALGVLFLFSHRLFYYAKYVYIWIRDTRVGEITIMVADFYRVFFQSQIFVLAVVFAAALMVLYSRSLRDRTARWAAAFICWTMVSMVLSLSRSFWFGGLVAACALLALLIWARAEAKVWRRLVGLGVGAVVGAVMIVGVVYAFPWPSKTGDMSLAFLLGSRAFSLSGEAAANSRWALLPKLHEAGAKRPFFGSGLGTSVTYTTSDPRLLADNPTGAYTTYAFEWGYHDLWVKFGLLGLAVYGWLLWYIAKPLLTAVQSCRDCFRSATLPSSDGKKETAVLAAGLMLGLVAMLATNIFSPYLNHPLGIGILMILGALGAAQSFSVATGGSVSSSAPAKSG